MKKIITLTLLIAFAVGGAIAQQKGMTPAQERKAERARQEAIEIQRLVNAIRTKTFYFVGQSMQIRNLDLYNLRAPYNYVDLQPGYIRVQLPYFTSINTMSNKPLILDFESENVTYTVTEKRGVYTVVVEAKDVLNAQVSTHGSQSSSYRMVFLIGSTNGGNSVTLSLTPSFTSTITYNGLLSW